MTMHPDDGARKSREEALLAGLSAAASVTVEARAQVVWALRLLVAACALWGSDRLVERVSHRAEIETGLRRERLWEALAAQLSTERDNALGALDLAADRLALVEAALPALRDAALGPSRAAVLAAIGRVEAALGAVARRAAA